MTHIRTLIHKYKLLAVLLAAFLTVLLLMMLVRVPERAKINTLPEQNGVYDLTETTELNTSAVHLTPPDTYYPNTYLMSENEDRAVPVSTKEFDARRADYLSQRFVLLLPEDGVYTLTFQLSGRHALRAYVNGKLTGETGRLGTTRQDTEVWENNLTVSAAPKDGKMEIILHSAQFYYAGKGAALAELTVSPVGIGFNDFAGRKNIGLAMFGALLSAGLLLLGIYLLFAHTKATLYFALACFDIALREILTSQAWTDFPLSGALSFRLEYLTIVLLAVFLSLYLGEYAKGKFLHLVKYVMLSGAGIYGLCVLFGDSLLYTSVLTYYQILLILCIVPGITGVLYTMRRPDREQTAAAYGIAVFFLAVFHDILMYSHGFGTLPKKPLTEMAMLVFVLAQAISLFIMNNRVLSEAKAAEQKLAVENAALEDLNRMKTEFLGNVSHELKTPLTVVSGHAQLLGAQLVGEKMAVARDKSRIISSEADRLALMVGQVLDVTRIEENRLTVDKRPCHIDELIYNAVEMHFPILNKAGNRLEIHAELDLPVVACDPGRITQVLVNLIANALRHTEQGEVTIAAKERNGFMDVSVSDTGAGISPDELSHLFIRYRPGSGETGTGLGLYICKYLVEEHGGNIRVESALGKGTAFTFSLPLS